MFSRDVEITKLIAQVRALAQQDPVGPGHFVQDLQAELEREPGANVSFVVRDAAWLKELGYLDDRPELSLTEKQVALNEACADFFEGSASQDGVTYAMEAVLDRIAPRMDGPEPM